MAVSVGGVDVDVVVDSASDANLISEDLWKKLKTQKVECVSRTVNKKLYGYSSSTPLDVLGIFEAEVIAGESKTFAEFVVTKGDEIPLLGRDTALKLGVLKIGLNLVHKVDDVESHMKKQYPNVFEGLGKLKDRQVHLSVDPQVRPVAQPLRRTPFALRTKVEEKIQELIDADVVEECHEPSEWVSPVVVVPKQNQKDIRVCVDMRRVNEAILRQRHPIPTIEEILQDLTGGTVFTKLDLKYGYHQLELDPESRPITTFVTHSGMYRYKRLCFGINTAAEIYQYEIHRVIQGIEGVANISDDIIIYGRTQEEHDERLAKVMKRLANAGLTVNSKKCLFSVSEMTFMGHKLCAKGIKPTDDRIAAVKNARQPENASEVRSFLGLVNFSAKFVPDLASISEPLRQLTKKGQPFVFGKKEMEAFQKLKQCISNAGILAFFDPNRKTQVIADASPV